VDEIQRLPSLLNEVHRFIEDQRMRFVLLGSSARKLKQAGTNLLAGRALYRQMFPLLPQELGRDFNLAEVLRHGSLPVIWAAPDRREALESYVQMYLKEEIQAESLASKDFAGLRAIHGLAGLDRRLIVYLGDRPQRTEDGIDVLPLGGFLAALKERSLW